MFAFVSIGLVGSPASAVEFEALVADQGDQAQLRGINRSGSEYACVQGWGVFDGPTDRESIRAMIDWGVTTVRVPLNESCWLGLSGVPPEYGGSDYREAIIDYVDLLLDSGMTVVLDLHWSSTTDAAMGQEQMANTAHSTAFWTDVAGTFADRQRMLFDVFNEPHELTWDCWLHGCEEHAGMQDLVDAVRGAGARQPIIVSGLEWGNDLRGWLRHRPEDPLDSIVAGVHIYDFNRCATPGCWDAELAPVAAKVPMVITEFGASDCTGEWAESLMDWADARGVSYLAWAWNPWSCAGGPALIESFDGAPTTYGAAVRRHLRAAAGHGGWFVDDDGSVHEEDIDRIASAGLTRGCNPPDNDRYCPDSTLTRGQGAAFLARVFQFDRPPVDAFVDDEDSLFEPEIDALAAAGLTRGCNPPDNDRYCPDEPVTRAQWASFLVRALGLNHAPEGDLFVDDDGSVHQEDIERIAAAGLTRGCNPPDNDRYCPDEPVTRAQAASFFARLIDLRASRR